MPEDFKAVSDICAVDDRSRTVLVDRETGPLRELTLEDIHAELLTFRLNPSVPSEVQDHFTTAKHLALYSWFVYRFTTIAQLHAFGSLEFALRLRLNRDDSNRPVTLRPLLEEAVAKGLLSPPALVAQIQRPSGSARMTAEEWLKALPENVAGLRNSLAHGSSDLRPRFWQQFRLITDTINQLYPEAC